MLINYIPGEECRVAVVCNDKLDELHAERLNAISHVGNVYVGRVMNVEPSIQAAFIDFGLEHNGFLHISDLHPQYFPGESATTTELVGKKTPRRQRPPIQEALKRGQEIIVQVLKEGIGTKGPTLTSYLSIPGRFLVMMPVMDKVGVSRKVEDEDQRREMRKILDQLDLPDGFGFILRTAGMDRTKTELKRDLAYLMRLWKDMERRRKAGAKPRLLYAESDLLVRALRDVLTGEIDEIIIDDLSALNRASRFLKIVAPRSNIKLLQYDLPTPIYHTYGIEEQIKRIHSREVPLPSGGSLVFDEAEACVAIDVNSGRMRSHGDAETTAYKTNCEAVDEICRQLRLRDLGGLVINDLIDMRSRAHQRDIEQRFRTNLKKDRARSKILPTSQFGIIEMTRQRMRGSLRSVHFSDCPICAGRGLVQRPESLANDGMRELANLLGQPRVHKVEMVVSPRVAGELLSSKRQRLGRLERLANKQVDVRVSETISFSRVVFYAYDERGADIEIDKLPAPKSPENLHEWDVQPRPEQNWAVDPLDEAQQSLAESLEPAPGSQDTSDLDLVEIEDVEPLESESEESGGKKKRRRRRRRGRKDKQDVTTTEAAAAPDGESTKESKPSAPERPEPAGDDGDGEETGGRRKRRRRRRRRGGRGADTEQRDQKQDSQAPIREDIGARDARETRDVREANEAHHWDEEEEELPPPPRNTGLRGDSWDLEPGAVTPARPAPSAPKPEASEPSRDAAEPAKESTPAPDADKAKGARRSRGSGKKKAARAAATETSVDALMDDVAAAKAPKKRAPKPEPASDDRGDSWDLEPGAVTPATPQPAPADAETKGDRKPAASNKRKKSSRKKSSRAAATSAPPDPSDNGDAHAAANANSKPAAKSKKKPRKRSSSKKKAKSGAPAKGQKKKQARAGAPGDSTEN